MSLTQESEDQPEGEPPREGSLFTRDFLLLSLAGFAYFTSAQFLLPTIPLYAAHLGASTVEIGLVVAAQSITALFCRPLIGWQLDRGPRLKVLMAGALVAVLCAVAYQLANHVWLLIGLRVVHGASWAAFGTAAFTLVGDVAPRGQRGQAIGLFGTAIGLGMTVGPISGTYLLEKLGFLALFLFSAGVAGACLPLVWAMGESPRPSRLVGFKPLFFNPSALSPSAVLAAVAFAYGPLASFLPGYTLERQMGNAGIFFSTYALSSLITRGLSGTLSDRWGRRAVTIPGLLAMGLCPWVLALGSGVGTLLFSAILFGLGGGALYPALTALTFDRATEASRGSAMATFDSSWDLGVTTGAVTMGFLLGPIGYRNMFLILGFLPFASTGILLASRERTAAG